MAQSFARLMLSCGPALQEPTDSGPLFDLFFEFVVSFLKLKFHHTKWHFLEELARQLVPMRANTTTSTGGATAAPEATLALLEALRGAKPDLEVQAGAMNRLALDTSGLRDMVDDPSPSPLPSLACSPRALQPHRDAEQAKLNRGHRAAAAARIKQRSQPTNTLTVTNARRSLELVARLRTQFTSALDQRESHGHPCAGQTAAVLHAPNHVSPLIHQVVSPSLVPGWSGDAPASPPRATPRSPRRPPSANPRTNRESWGSRRLTSPQPRPPQQPQLPQQPQYNYCQHDQEGHYSDPQPPQHHHHQEHNLLPQQHFHHDDKEFQQHQRDSPHSDAFEPEPGDVTLGRGFTPGAWPTWLVRGKVALC